MIHLIIIRLEGYSQRSVTMNVFPLQLLRVMFQDKLKNSFCGAYRARCLVLPEQFLYNQSARQNGEQYFLGDRRDRWLLLRPTF